MDDQKSVLAQVRQLVCEERRSVFITGGAGTGKTHLQQRLVEWLRAAGLRVAVTASTGTAAWQTGDAQGAMTIHSFAGMQPGSRTARHTAPLFARGPWDVLIIDEISMVSAEMLDWLEATVSEAAARHHHHQQEAAKRPWGGTQLILLGDFFQLPPVIKDTNPLRTRSFRHSRYNTAAAAFGGDAPPPAKTLDGYFYMFSKASAPALAQDPMLLTSSAAMEMDTGPAPVFAFQSKAWARTFFDPAQQIIQLHTVHRQHGDPEFAALLNRMRTGQFPDEDAQLLQTRCSSSSSSTTDSLAPRLYAHARAARQTNQLALTTLPGPSHRYPVLGKRTVAPEDDELELRADALVILKTNAYHRSHGLTSGARARVVGFEFFGTQDADTPLAGQEMLPLVEFEASPPLRPAPVRILVARQANVERTEWRMPLQLGWAITIHGCQGMTLDALAVDLGPSLFAEHQAYVALSRVRSLAGLRLLQFDADTIRTRAGAHPTVKAFYDKLQ
jgi:hypothetical protein